MSEWQPIDTAPPDRQIIVWWKGRSVLAVYRPRSYHNRGRNGWRVSDLPANPWLWVMVPPTAWMPLPDGPK